ncbi:MAG: cell division protein FtsA [Candidatus Paceibacterota bacterium]|jgi:cell division protein FtsA
MARKIAVGIDIGSYQIKVVVAEHLKDKPNPQILGMGYAESRGLRHGYILSLSDAARSLRVAIEQAEKTAKIKIRKAFVSVGGIGLGSVTSQASVVVSKADSEITELDVKKVLEQSERDIPASQSANRKILHTIPLQYKVDGKPVLGRPHGMRGSKLEVRTLFITSLDQHLNDLIQAVAEAGVDVEDVMAAPLAASLVTLSKQQKIAGCVLANIGSETVSIAIFENNIPISLDVFPIGSTDITNDIALGLKISLEDAEKLKVGTDGEIQYPRKKLEEIILARLSDIFDLIEAHLKKVGRSGLLPAGIIITGGGSGITTIEDLAKAALKLPSRIGTLSFGAHLGDHIKDATWSVAYGLCIWGLTTSDDASLGTKMIKQGGGDLMKMIQRFLP